MDLLETTVCAGAGLLATPCLEYAWHAWIAHGRRADPTREAHLEHHRTASVVVDPWDEMSENAPRLGVALLSVGGALTLLVGPRRSLPLAAGMLGGYVLTTLYHARMHRRGPRTPYEEWMWRFHWHHHAVDARKNFGLTSPLLDFVFGTAVVPDAVDVPEKLAPAWLRRETAGIRVARRPAET